MTRLTLACRAAALFVVTTALPGCSDADDAATPPWDGKPTPAPAGKPWSKLSAWHLFADGSEQAEPAEGVVPFEVISVLFADFAQKGRWLWVPPGQTITYDATQRWDLPTGSILAKSFWFPKDERDPTLGRTLLETRLLVHEPDGWVGHTYLWDESATEATRYAAGKSLPVSWIDASGTPRDQTYNVPNTFDCQSCHGVAPDTHPLGPRTRQLDRSRDYGSGPENQLDHLAALGLFDVAPAADRVHLVDPYAPGDAALRARSYLDANCSHCHGVGGKAESTNFLLSFDKTDPATGDPLNWGICKFPTSAGHGTAGRTYDIVPGSPDESIITARLASTDPAVKMPPILSTQIDTRGVALVGEWISGMTPTGCPSP